MSHRALILNSIARGAATISHISGGDDVVSTRRCLEALGVRIEDGAAGSITVHGPSGLHEPTNILDVGNSGTSLRLLAGLLAPQPFLSVLTGDASLRSRPMGRVVEPLTRMGSNILARRDGTLAPLVIRGGPLRGIEYDMPVASAQVKSAIVIAALFAESETVIHQPGPSRDHTERMVRAMGGGIVEDGLSLVTRPSTLTAVDVSVPGDISSAAFWLVAGACHPSARVRIKGAGVNPSRTGVLEVLDAMGASITWENRRLEGGEPVADLTVESGELSATEIGGEMIARCIDELPVLAVAACFAQGTTVIRDAQELRVKESDRIATTAQELTRLGAVVEERPDGLAVHGTGRLAGGDCESHGDHRLAMALAVAGLLADGPVSIKGADDASVSYPGFWDDLELLTSATIGRSL